MCCESYGRDEHQRHAAHGHIYHLAIKQEATGQRQRSRKHISDEGREVIGEGDEGASAHATDYKCKESPLYDIVGKQ